MKLFEILNENVMIFSRNKDYINERNNAMQSKEGFLPYTLTKLIQKYKITTYDKAIQNFLPDSPEWSIFRDIQQSKVIKAVRRIIGPGKTDNTDYHTRVIRMNSKHKMTELNLLFSQKMGAPRAQSKNISWYSLVVEQEQFWIGVPKTDDILSHVMLIPHDNITIQEILQMDSNIVKKIQGAINFAAQLQRRQMHDVETSKQAKQQFDTDWL